MTRIDVQVDDIEIEGFGEQLENYLTFDLVTPHVIEGKVGFYNGKIYIIMSNGDSISYEYTVPEFPSDTKNEHIVSINNRNSFSLGELDDHPGIYIRNVYSQYLQYVLMHKHAPREIQTIGLVESGKLKLNFR